MSAFAPLLQSFFTDRLIGQRGSSENTITGYRDTFRLLLVFAAARTGKKPSALDIADLDAPLIGAFLDHLEHERGNQVRTRNNRLVLTAASDDHEGVTFGDDVKEPAGMHGRAGWGGRHRVAAVVILSRSCGAWLRRRCVLVSRRVPAREAALGRSSR